MRLRVTEGDGRTARFTLEAGADKPEADLVIDPASGVTPQTHRDWVETTGGTRPIPVDPEGGDDGLGGGVAGVRPAG